MTSKRAVVEFLESVGSVNVTKLCSAFASTQRAAESHLERLWRRGLIEESRAGSFVLSYRGRQRLAWYSGEISGEKIRFV